jgi:uncharacterized protein YjdB
MKRYQLLPITALFVCLTAVAGCSDTSDVVDDGKGVASVEISPDKVTLTQGIMFQFTATVKYADGTSRNVTEDGDTIWNTSDAALATVEDGMVTTIAESLDVNISAAYLTEKGEEHFAITP